MLWEKNDQSVILCMNRRYPIHVEQSSNCWAIATTVPSSAQPWLPCAGRKDHAAARPAEPVQPSEEALRRLAA
ncbi:hypothetical protein SACS_1817 [Parasaccharibacter apium]|uniref:Uncharacterized protein n=1 Tax=Parasaccharibacter apium TaxID=1510841 RepID=A0A7U7G3Z1_9PROT|nr:hypothetical protein SACS_1817 [Parasaccharibacter apium]